jgi:hypothetical protein
MEFFSLTSSGCMMLQKAEALGVNLNDDIPEATLSTSSSFPAMSLPA